MSIGFLLKQFLFKHLVNNFLSECDKNCRKCEINGNGKCDRDQCETGYFYDATERKCYKNKIGCKISRRNGGITECWTCDSTKSVYVDGQCKPCGNGCYGCLYDSLINKVICSSCTVGFYNSAGECKPCNVGCSACTSFDLCTSCLPNYGLKNKLCSPCVSKCELCETSANNIHNNLECKKCSSNFYLNIDDCGECPKFCKECSYTNKYKCLNCINHYARTADGSCVPCPSNCKTCTVNFDNTATCTECLSKKFAIQSDGTCKICSKATFANCELCENTKSENKANCIGCFPGFTLKDDRTTCLPCSIVGCERCVHGRLCEKCAANLRSNIYRTGCGCK